jgi:hypothetical protein
MSDAIETFDRRHPSESSLLNHETLDDSFHYRFIQERPTQVARAKLKGYKIVRPSETGEETIFEQEDADAQDIIKHGDRILMKIPKKGHLQHRERTRERALNRLRTPDQKVRAQAKERGIKIHDEDDEE